MILYLDTSSLVKLYIEEEGSADVKKLVSHSDVVATSVVAFPETRSAFSRLAREESLTGEQLPAVRDAFLRDWGLIFKLQARRRVYERAGDLTEEHALRGFDAIHLASFLELLEHAPDRNIHFSAFDDRLNSAVAAVWSAWEE